MGGTRRAGGVNDERIVILTGAILRRRWYAVRKPRLELDDWQHFGERILASNGVIHHATALRRGRYEQAAAVAQDVTDLRGGQVSVHRNNDRTQAQCGKDRYDKLRGVVRHQRQAISVRKAHSGPQTGPARDFAVKFSPRPTAVRADQRLDIGDTLSVCDDTSADGGHGHPPQSFQATWEGINRL